MFDAPTDFCRLFLFRHPELDPAHAERAVGAGPADLSRRGRAQILHWLELLKPVDVSRNYGNRHGVLPFTAIVDATGVIAYIHSGTLDANDLSNLLQPLLARGS